MLLQTSVLAQFLVGRNLYFALAFVAQTRAFPFHLAVGQFDLAWLRTVPADLSARLARRALPGDLLRAQPENGLQGVDLDFLNHVLRLFPIPVGPTNKAFWFCRTDSLRDCVAAVSYLTSMCSAGTAATRTSVLMSVTVQAVHSIADSLTFDVR